jgi:hypothetical protein
MSGYAPRVRAVAGGVYAGGTVAGRGGGGRAGACGAGEAAGGPGAGEIVRMLMQDHLDARGGWRAAARAGDRPGRDLPPAGRAGAYQAAGQRARAGSRVADRLPGARRAEPGARWVPAVPASGPGRGSRLRGRPRWMPTGPTTCSASARATIPTATPWQPDAYSKKRTPKQEVLTPADWLRCLQVPAVGGHPGSARLILIRKSHERCVAGHGVSQAHLFQLG